MSGAEQVLNASVGLWKASPAGAPALWKCYMGLLTDGGAGPKEPPLPHGRKRKEALLGLSDGGDLVNVTKCVWRGVSPFTAVYLALFPDPCESGWTLCVRLNREVRSSGEDALVLLPGGFRFPLKGA